ncbi:hypothetical protein CUMW_236610 [Citrus unshiu]|nr:hypothetical protein CUMW_236610 [Citrus unshiu]
MTQCSISIPIGPLTLHTVVSSLVFLILFFVSNFSLPISSDSNEEAHALRKSKASLQSHNRSLLPSWTIATTNVSSDITLCAWSGIGCNAAGRVVYINFTNTGLSGTLHDFSFSSFPHLTYLDLSFNELFGNLKSLAVLELNANQLNGSIPPSMGNLSSLIRLYLYDNSLYGSIPPNVGNLKSLAVLKLYANQLNGCIPRSFGFLPPPIGNLTDLQILDLMDNHLSDSITPSLGNICRVEEIPKELGKLNSLTKLILRGNQLTRHLPTEIGSNIVL